MNDDCLGIEDFDTTASFVDPSRAGAPKAAAASALDAFPNPSGTSASRK